MQTRCSTWPARKLQLEDLYMIAYENRIIFVPDFLFGVLHFIYSMLHRASSPNAVLHVVQ